MPFDLNKLQNKSSPGEELSFNIKILMSLIVILGCKLNVFCLDDIKFIGLILGGFLRDLLIICVVF